MENNRRVPRGHAYRASLINGMGRVQMSISVPAETDDEARRQVVDLTRLHAVELFDHGRLVAALKIGRSRP